MWQRSIACMTMLVIARLSAAEAGAVHPALAIADRQIAEFHSEHQKQLFVVPAAVRVKSILCATREMAEAARRRAVAGEDLDSLIVDNYVPYFRAHSGKAHPYETVDWGYRGRDEFWRDGDKPGPIARLAIGELSAPVPLPDGAPGFAILRILNERKERTIPLAEARDWMYMHLCNRAIDRDILKKVDFGRNPWCGTCVAGHDPKGQLMRLAEGLVRDRKEAEGIGAALLALSHSGLARPDDKGYYPDEGFLAQRGLDLVRYYGGVLDDAIWNDSNSWQAGLIYTLSTRSDPRIVPMLARVAASQGALSQYAVAALGRMKAESTIPLLRELLKDETLWLVSPHPYGGARYPIREAAVEALREIGQAVTGVKTTLSPETRPRSG